MDGVATTCAADHLFQTNPSPNFLSHEQAKFFYHNKAKVLLLCKWVHPDIQTAMALLSTCVQHTDEDDYKRLGCVMKHLCDTMELPLTLEADESNIYFRGLMAL